MTLTVKEFKRFVAEIPETFDDAQLTYVDFSYADSLQCGLTAGNDVTIMEWGEYQHIYWEQTNDNICKQIQAYKSKL